MPKIHGDHLKTDQSAIASLTTTPLTDLHLKQFSPGFLPFECRFVEHHPLLQMSSIADRSGFRLGCRKKAGRLTHYPSPYQVARKLVVIGDGAAGKTSYVALL